MDIPELIRRIETELKAQSLTRAELATRAGLSRVTVWRVLERITEHPRKQTVWRLARATGIRDANIRESLSGQYELLPVTEQLPGDDVLFQEALVSQLEAVPKHLRLEAVRVAMGAMAGVIHREAEDPAEDPYRFLRQLEKSRWNARKRYKADPRD
jgi:transcriptional regulator with XRE-family HTH domain